MKHITNCFSSELISLCQKSYATDKWKDIIQLFLKAPLNQHVQLGTFEKNKLVLVVDCPLWASELRPRIPELRDYLRKEHQCYGLSHIQVKIQPDFFKT
jgi:hypothetical protein